MYIQFYYERVERERRILEAPKHSEQFFRFKYVCRIGAPMLVNWGHLQFYRDLAPSIPNLFPFVLYNLSKDFYKSFTAITLTH